MAGISDKSSESFRLMKFTFASALAAISAVTSVAAHGYVDQVIIGSTTYTGYQPYR
jgi:hypothetical protein